MKMCFPSFYEDPINVNKIKFLVAQTITGFYQLLPLQILVQNKKMKPEVPLVTLVPC